MKNDNIVEIDAEIAKITVITVDGDEHIFTMGGKTTIAHMQGNDGIICAEEYANSPFAYVAKAEQVARELIFAQAAQGVIEVRHEMKTAIIPLQQVKKIIIEKLPEQNIFRFRCNKKQLAESRKLENTTSSLGPAGCGGLHSTANKNPYNRGIRHL